MSRHSLVSSLLMSLAAVPATAADAAGSAELQTVTIVGLTPVGGTQPADEASGTVQTASGATLQSSRAGDLSAFLNRRMGSVHINEMQGNPLQADLGYRGYTASPLLGTPQGLSVYLDGVRLNQPFGDVVSWDLVPRAAIARIELLTGGSPLYGFNSLGGALTVRTKDGYSAPGAQLDLSLGGHDRRQLEFESGGHANSGWHWYATASRLQDDGWRTDSASRADQALGKLGYHGTHSDISLTASGSDTDLNGNGLQDFRLLQSDYASVYTRPDSTRNRATLWNLQFQHEFDGGTTLSGNAWYRTIRTHTVNGDVNPSSLGESLYQPTVAEQAALTAAGYSGFPGSGETQSNTPFPRWRCIANALLNDEPDEKCDGLINRTNLQQHARGAAVQADAWRRLRGHEHRLTAGLTFEDSDARFQQSAEFGFLTPDRAVVGVAGPGAFADGSQDSENAIDARVDLSGRIRTRSVFAADSMALARRLRANLAARYDHSHVATSDALTSPGSAGSLAGDHAYSRVNASLGLVLQVSTAHTVYGSYSEASRAPSAVELGCADPVDPCRLPNAMAGDPPLDQVVTRTVEAGWRGHAGQAITWSAAVFRGDSHDDILFVAANQSGFGYFRNVPRTRRQGIELGVDAHTRRWTFGARYTLLDASFQSAVTLNGDANSSNSAALPGFGGTIRVRPGDRLPLIPRQIAKAVVEWQALPTLSIQTDLDLTGTAMARGNENGAHRPDGSYYLGPGHSGGYAVWNAGAEWRPTPRATLYLQVDNLLDRRYATAAQLGTAAFNAAGAFVARPFAGPIIAGERPLLRTTLLAPGAPRSVLVGVRFRWGD